MVWAPTALRPPRLVVTDSEYVANGVMTMLAGASAPLLDGPHGDLWRLLPAELPQVPWKPAHLEWEVARDRCAPAA